MAVDRTLLKKILTPPAKPHHDPWAKADVWRNHSFFGFRNNLRGMFPGLGIATVIFTAYCVGEYLYDKTQHSADTKDKH
ncbi:hypothetical protein GQ42DRAFT_93466 [Ramicandelaber brevisporus]|nr:hypothetical protein GQ42DRAFT_93466 [Ramicandelaber brevisporus]